MATLGSVMPVLLAADCAFESGRGHLLAAKCQAALAEEEVALAPKNDAAALAARRAGLLEAIRHLTLAEGYFTAVDSYARLKDVLYMKVSLNIS
jgi:hypothetical protein